MLGEFESRLADVLGTRLTAPFGGAVDVDPGVNSSRILVRVRNAGPVDDDLLSLRPERVPGGTAPRRVVRLRCEVGLEMRLPPGGDRTDEMSGLDQALYLLEDSSFRDGTALLPDDASDPGFVIRSMRLTGTQPPTSITLEADGLFWPVGVAGESGPQITATRIRAVFKPLLLNPADPRLTPGGAGLDLGIEFGAVGTMNVAQDGAVAPGAFGSVLASVIDSGGRPGAGALTGGNDGPAGSRLLTVTNGVATVHYTPPASAAVDNLVIRLEDNEGGPGIELGRFILRVRSN